MTLTELLKVDLSLIGRSHLPGLRFAERVWQSNGRPSEGKALEDFLEAVIEESKKVGILYPAVLLKRLKGLRCGEFRPEPLAQPATDAQAEPGACSRCRGWGFTWSPGGATGSLCPACLGSGRR
jgi:hypothetical protein